MAVHIRQFMCLSDNYGVLLHDPDTRHTATIDAPEAGPILKALDDNGWDLTEILVTHHHADHTQGIGALKERFPNARLIGPSKEADKIRGLEVTLSEGDFVMVGSLKAKIIEVPGHTAGHIAYHFANQEILFAGDTLFALGCGRPFEAPAHVLYRSLNKLARLPGCTQVYCGHEYTLSNARFALKIEGDNQMLVERAAEIERQREDGQFTLPTTISIERATNPFLRADEDSVKSALGMANADAVDIFTELRERKNRG